MKIAIPTNDGITISEHFGRSDSFLVFEVADGRITSREVRANRMHHATENGNCGQHGEHSHAPILSVLAGCDVVICAGMGHRAADALKQGGIGTVIMTAPGPAQEKIEAYLAGKLSSTEASFCRCTHHSAGRS